MTKGGRGQTGGGNGIVKGNRHDNTVTGTAESETLLGLEGNDTLFGLAGLDTIEGNEGDDHLFGGLDDDALFGGEGSDRLEGDEGNDHLDGGLGDDSLFGGLGDDTLFGGDGADFLDGGEGDNTLFGGDGSDDFELSLGTNSVDGGAGIDTAIFDQSIGAYVITAIDATTVSIMGVSGTSAVTNVESFSFGGETFTLDELLNLPTENDDTIDGTPGDDTIDALGGDDLIIVSTGSDVFFGGFGLDRIDFSGAGAAILAGTPVTGPVDPVPYEILFSGQPGSVTLFGVEVIEGSAFGDLIRLFQNVFEAHGGGGDDQILGLSSDPMRIFGDAGNDSITGAGGADHIDGGGDDDSIAGRGGDDHVIFSGGIDTVDGGSGWDVLDFSGSQFAIGDFCSGPAPGLAGPPPDLVLHRLCTSDGSMVDFFGVEEIIGTDLADLIRLSSPAEYLSVFTTARGGLGNDTIIGSIHDDTIFGGTGDDSIDAGAGSDTLFGGDGNDTAHAGSGSNDFFGGRGVDTAIFDLTVDNYSIVRTGAFSLSVSDGAGLVTRVASTELFRFGGVDQTFDDLIGGPSSPTEGADTIDLTPADDTIDALGGNDIIVGSTGIDRVVGGAGTDTIDFSRLDDRILGGLTPIPGQDPEPYVISIGVVTPTSDTSVIFGVEVIRGTEFDDSIIILQDLREAHGGEGDDELIGGVNSDSLFGGDGNDVIRGSAGNDSVEGGAGYDFLDFSGMASAITRMVGPTPVLSAPSESGAPSESPGFYSAEFADGSTTQWTGIQELIGTDFGDTIAVGGVQVSDILVARGGLGDDTITGASGDDSLVGDGGDDVIEGRGGDDRISLGVGADIVQVTRFLQGTDVLGEGFDTVFDFNPTDDKIGIDRDPDLDVFDPLLLITLTDDGARIDYADDSFILLAGVDGALLTADNFLLLPEPPDPPVLP